MSLDPPFEIIFSPPLIVNQLVCSINLSLNSRVSGDIPIVSFHCEKDQYAYWSFSQWKETIGISPETLEFRDRLMEQTSWFTINGGEKIISKGGSKDMSPPQGSVPRKSRSF